MRHRIMTTRDDLRNWVDAETSGWWERGKGYVDAITAAILVGDHPAWGTDWTEFLAALPDIRNEP